METTVIGHISCSFGVRDVVFCIRIPALIKDIFSCSKQNSKYHNQKPSFTVKAPLNASLFEHLDF